MKIHALYSHKKYLNGLLNSEEHPKRKKSLQISDEEEMESLMVEKNFKLAIM